MVISYKDYKYLYETHLHTCEASACASNTGYEMAKAAKEYGYSGIIVTDHNWGGNTCIPKNLNWEKWVDAYAAGYESAYKYGVEHDLDVFFGCEAGFNGTEFLLYGITPDWLKTHPELRNATIKEMYELVSENGGMMVHAHPYREEWYIPEIRLFPELIHGVEGINATHSNRLSTAHNDPMYDTKAIEYARKLSLPMTAGSDIHSTNLFGGGMLFKKRIKTMSDFIATVKSKDYLLTNGDTVYSSNGDVLL